MPQATPQAPRLQLVPDPPPSESTLPAVPQQMADPMAPLWEEENTKLRAEIAMLRAKDVLRDAGINPKPEVMAALRLLMSVT